MPTMSPSPLEATNPVLSGAMPQPLLSVVNANGVRASASIASRLSPSGELTAISFPSRDAATEPT